MGVKPIGRRAFLQSAGITVLTATGVVRGAEDRTLQTVPNSSGTEQPRLKAPANAADCHIHVFDPQNFPPPADGPGAMGLSNASAQDYRLLQKRNRTTRVVIVTSRNYVTDNRCTVASIAQFGSNARGIAVLHPTVTDAELRDLDKGGIRGIRCSRSRVVSIDMVEPLVKRVADLGWHVQFNIPAEDIVKNVDMLRRLPTPIVFDHLGSLGGEHATTPTGLDHPAYGVIRGLIDKGSTWVKLSGAYLNTKIGPPTYADATVIAQAYVKAAPERLVWGSDWPHPGKDHPKPNDATLFDLLTMWAPDEAMRNRILVSNPEVLYGFSKSA